MIPLIRPAAAEELDALSNLCLRSKAHWGYDAGFMEACKAELTLTREDLETSHVMVASRGSLAEGVIQLVLEGEEAILEKLFVDPSVIGGGVGKALFGWAMETARLHGASHMTIEADPDAAAFYQKMGAQVVGSVPSGSIAGRFLPKLRLKL